MEESQNFRELMFQRFEAIKNLMDKMMIPALQAYGLTPLTAMLLYTIKQHEGISVGALQKKLDQNQGNLSSLCKKLETQGFLTRTRKKADERIVCLTLTDKGKETLSCMHDGLLAFDQLLETIDEGKKLSVLQGLEDLASIMKEILEGGQLDA